MLLTIIIGFIGVPVFMGIHIPLPWMLGPLSALLIGSRVCKKRLYWPAGLRNLAMIIIGYSCGSSINKQTAYQIVRQLPWMLIASVCLLAFSAVTAYGVSRFTKTDYPSILAGCIPGGITQMVMLGEEIEGLDLTIITFFQVLRLILVVFCVPLFICSPLYSRGNAAHVAAVQQAVETQPEGSVLKIFLIVVIAVISVFLAKKLKFPTPYFLGPILGITICNLSGFYSPALSPCLLYAAQFSMGCYLGLSLKPESLQNKVKLISFSLINGLILILFSLFLGYLLGNIHGLTSATGFLCMAPGAADQMGVIAGTIAADVSLVTGYQVFRMLFVNFAVPPLLRVFFRHYAKKKQGNPL